MTDSLSLALRVIDSLNQHAVEYVVIGGVAVNFHGLARGTEDLDFFVRPDPENIARLRAALRDVWDDPTIEEISAADLCGDYPSVRYGPPSGPFYLDILTRLGSLASYDDIEVEEVAIEGIVARVATPETLYRLKKGTVRPIDHADAAALKRAFDIEDGE
jgi:hypothetical protein